MGEIGLHLAQHSLRAHTLGNVDDADQQLAIRHRFRRKTRGEECVEHVAIEFAELAFGGVAGFAADGGEHAGGVNVIALVRPIDIERSQHLGFDATAKERDGLLVDVDDARRLHHGADEGGVFGEVRSVVFDALAAQFAQHAADRFEIEFPKRRRHRLKEIAVAILALAQGLFGALLWSRHHAPPLARAPLFRQRTLQAIDQSFGGERLSENTERAALNGALA